METAPQSEPDESLIPEAKKVKVQGRSAVVQPEEDIAILSDENYSESESDSSSVKEEEHEQEITPKPQPTEATPPSIKILQPKHFPRSALTYADLDALMERVGPPPSSTIYLGGINGPGGRASSSSRSRLSVSEICDFVVERMRCKKPLLAVRLLPEKACCFIDFCDHVDAVDFFRRAMGGGDGQDEFYRLRRLVNVAGVELRVGWAPPTKDLELGSKMNPNSTSSTSRTTLGTAVRSGATRCVFLHPVEGGSEAFLGRLFGPFGPIDQIRVLQDARSAAFIHLASISKAMEAVAALNSMRRWKRVAFARDRVCRSDPNRKKKPHHSSPTGALNPNPLITVANRTVFLAGIPPPTTLCDLCNVIRAGGPVLSVRFVTSSRPLSPNTEARHKAAFVTFVEAEAAQTFYDVASAATLGVHVHGKRLKVAWAKAVTSDSSSSLSSSAALVRLLQQGATRCLAIGPLESIDGHDLLYQQSASITTTSRSISSGCPSQVYHDGLERFFSGFTLESVSIGRSADNGNSKASASTSEDAIIRLLPPTCRIAYVNFASISDAAKALAMIHGDPRFAPARVFYGRDRCAAPLNPELLATLKSASTGKKGSADDSNSLNINGIVYQDPQAFLSSLRNNSQSL